MSYHTYNADDFAADPNFRKWVLGGDLDSNYFWEKWLLYNPDRREVVEEARALVLALADSNADIPVDTDMLWLRINTEISNLEQEKEDAPKVRPINEHVGKFTQGKQRPKNNPFKKLLSIAAILVTGVVAFVYLLGYWTETPEQPVIAPIPYVVKEVPNGQKLKMFLPDGSEVILNSASTLRFPSEFSATQRLVELKGEAYFEVAKDSLAPFIVRTPTVQTEVLGTSFNVKSYDDDSMTTVSLVEGSLRVSHPKESESVLLTPGEEVELANDTHTMIKSLIRDRESLDWTKGILSFRNAPMQEVFKKLEMWYGVEIESKGVPSKKRVTGTFENEYLTNVLESIQYTIRFDFEIKGDTVYVEFER